MRSSKPLDRVALVSYQCLLRDFRSLNGPDFARRAEEALARGINDFREYEWPSLGMLDANRFKAWHQLQHYLKRHRFVGDAYTDEDLAAKTLNGYLATQVRIGERRCRSPRILRVLQRARQICREILGNFNESDMPHHCQIGRRATLGGPLHSAYIDSKLGDPKAFTCPTSLKGWYFKHIQGDPLLQQVTRSIFKRSRSVGYRPNLSADSLNLVFVPKSWKSFRVITPLSLVGLYYSYGLGGIVTDRLRSAGLDIKHLQERHRRYAQVFSRTRSHVTADLSSASDSITSELLNAVLPRSWFVALKASFVRTVVHGGESFYTDSVLPMGNGATFPVETLVFYSLIKAIGDLLGKKGTYSVYGDDLIYPKSIHDYVRQVFAELNLAMNMEKTFVSSFFRESCGGDFYRGYDVRPALLPVETSTHLSGLRYQQYLYKALNGLLRRWSCEEIPITVRWFILEILSVSSSVLQVPQSYPDTSGLKVDVPYISWYVPFSQPRHFFKDGSCWIAFKAISVSKSQKRPILSEIPYYWDKLRSMSSREPDWRSGFGWFRVFPPLSILSVTRRHGKIVVESPSRESGRELVQGCLVSNWT